MRGIRTSKPNAQRGIKSVNTMLEHRGIRTQFQRVFFHPIAYVPYAMCTAADPAKEMAQHQLSVKFWGAGGMTVEGLDWPAVHLLIGRPDEVKKGKGTTVNIRTKAGGRAWAVAYDSAFDGLAKRSGDWLFVSLHPPKGGGLVNAFAFSLDEQWPNVIPLYSIRALSHRLVTLRSWADVLQQEIEDYIATDDWARSLHLHALSRYRASLRDLLFWIHMPPDVVRHRLAQSFSATAYHAYVRVMFSEALESLQYPDNPLSSLDIDPILSHLRSAGWKLTESQIDAIERFCLYLRRPYQLRALLYGETGSGKSLIAFCLAIAALRNNTSVLYLAPTRVLAEQQFRAFMKISEGVVPPNQVKLWTAKQKDDLDDQPSVYFGTHALFYMPKDKRVGLIFVDEEHKFSADQRASLSQQQHHLIRISATPSPLTWELADCGLIESVCIERERPGVITRVYSASEREAAYRQAMEWAGDSPLVVVCPYIGDRESVMRRVGSATAPYGSIEECLAFVSQGISKRRVVAAFSGVEHEVEALLRGDAPSQDLMLVTTNLMETGLNIPARVIVVERAESFGVSQLHQLRGRLSRLATSQTGYFIMISHAEAHSPSRRRLDLLVQHSSAAAINESIYRQRGQGDDPLPSERLGAWRRKPILSDYASEEDIAAMAEAMLEQRVAQSPDILEAMFGVRPAQMLM